MLTVLGRRLVLAGDDLAERDEITDKTAEVVVELGTLSAAYERDVHASPALRKVLTGLRERLDKWRTAEARLLAPAKGKPNVRLPAGRFAATDAKLVGELRHGGVERAQLAFDLRLEARIFGARVLLQQVSQPALVAGDLVDEIEHALEPLAIQPVREQGHPVLELADQRCSSPNRSPRSASSEPSSELVVRPSSLEHCWSLACAALVSPAANSLRTSAVQLAWELSSSASRWTN